MRLREEGVDRESLGGFGWGKERGTGSWRSGERLGLGASHRRMGDREPVGWVGQ